MRHFGTRTRTRSVAALFEGIPSKPPGFMEMIATNRRG
jgi:hypothetical protein